MTSKRNYDVFLQDRSSEQVLVDVSDPVLPAFDSGGLDQSFAAISPSSHDLDTFIDWPKDWNFNGHDVDNTEDLLALLEMDLSDDLPELSFGHNTENSQSASLRSPLTPSSVAVNSGWSNDNARQATAVPWSEQFLIAEHGAAQTPVYSSPNRHQPSSLKSTRPRIPQKQSKALMEWLATHSSDPYPTKADKETLADVSGLSVSQVHSWFTRARQRLRASLIASQNTHLDTSDTSYLNPNVGNTPNQDQLDLPTPQSNERATSLVSSNNLRSSMRVAAASPCAVRSISDVSLNSWADYEGMALSRSRGSQSLRPLGSSSHLSWWLETLPTESTSFGIAGVEPLPAKELFIDPITWSTKQDVTRRMPSIDPFLTTWSTSRDMISQLSSFDTDPDFCLPRKINHLQRKSRLLSFPIRESMVSTRTLGPEQQKPSTDCHLRKASTSSIDVQSELSSSTIASTTSVQSACSYTSFGGRSGRRLPRTHGLKQERSDERAKYKCTFCLQGFQDAWRWKRHESAVHVPHTVWVCKPWGEYCDWGLANCWMKPVDGRTFHRADGLRQHLESSHKLDLQAVDGPDWKTLASICKEKLELNIDLRCPFASCDQDNDNWTARTQHVQAHFDNGDQEFRTVGPPSTSLRPDFNLTRSNCLLHQCRLDGSPQQCPLAGCSWEALLGSEASMQMHFLTKHWSELQTDPKGQGLSTKPPAAFHLIGNFDIPMSQKRLRSEK